MSRISEYNVDTTVEGSDKLLGSNADGSTKNFKVVDVDVFMKNTSTSRLVYSYEATASLKSNGSFLGTFSGAPKTFATLQSIKVSKFPSGSDTASVQYLNTLLAKQIVLSDVNDINNFGVYTVESIAQDSSATDYYDIGLAVGASNGTIVDEQFYSIILYAGSTGDKNFVHTQSASSASWTINHSLAKKPSVTITTLATGVQVIGEVTYTNDNTLVCSFATAVSGIANLN